MCNCDLDYIDEAYKAKVWDAAIDEAFALGWIHDRAAEDMYERNPFRSDEL